MKRFLILATAMTLLGVSLGCGHFPYFRRGAACASCPTASGAVYGELSAPPAAAGPSSYTAPTY